MERDRGRETKMKVVLPNGDAIECSLQEYLALRGERPTTRREEVLAVQRAPTPGSEIRATRYFRNHMVWTQEEINLAKSALQNYPRRCKQRRKVWKNICKQLGRNKRAIVRKMWDEGVRLKDQRRKKQ